ncbi:hypothetical protein D3C75_583840 [compost metagenome]
MMVKLFQSFSVHSTSKMVAGSGGVRLTVRRSSMLKFIVIPLNIYGTKKMCITSCMRSHREVHLTAQMRPSLRRIREMTMSISLASIIIMTEPLRVGLIQL